MKAISSTSATIDDPGEERALVALLAAGVALSVPALEQVAEGDDDRLGDAQRPGQSFADVALRLGVAPGRRPVAEETHEALDPIHRRRPPPDSPQDVADELHRLVGVDEAHHRVQAEVVAAAVAAPPRARTTCSRGTCTSAR